MFFGICSPQILLYEIISINLSINIDIYLSISISLYLSISLSIYLSIYLHMLFIHLFLFLSIYLFLSMQWGIKGDWHKPVKTTILRKVSPPLFHFYYYWSSLFLLIVNYLVLHLSICLCSCLTIWNVDLICKVLD